MLEFLGYRARLAAELGWMPARFAMGRILPQNVL
jgi:hypothetical protein